jgi:hypothetical protein
MINDPNQNRLGDRLSSYTWRHPQHIRQEMQEAGPLNLPTGHPSDTPIHSELALWLYILKGVGLLLAGSFLVVNLMYGAFELLALLGE